MNITQSVEEINLTWFLNEIRSYNESAELKPVRESYRFSEMKHVGQTRMSGSAYFVHCKGTAKNLVSWRMDVDTISAGFLHDVLEDTETTAAELREKFGDNITEIVEGVSKISSLPFRGIESQAENFRKMILAMSRDIRVVLIKLADRLHNMRTLEFLPPDSQNRIAQETLDIYAPLAHRIGMSRISAELEDLSLQYLDGEAYYDIKKRVDEETEERGADVEELYNTIEEILLESGIKSEVRGRNKNIYSIYQNKGSSLFFFRIFMFIHYLQNSV